jgi:predicted transcriptional regulator
MELTAFASITEITTTALESLWQLARKSACVSRSEFDAYFDGLSVGTSIRLASIEPFNKSIPLQTLRNMWPDFIPPQGFRYLSAAEVGKIGRASTKLKVA